MTCAKIQMFKGETTVREIFIEFHTKVNDLCLEEFGKSHLFQVFCTVRNNIELVFLLIYLTFCLHLNQLLFDSVYSTRCCWISRFHWRNRNHHKQHDLEQSQFLKHFSEDNHGHDLVQHFSNFRVANHWLTEWLDRNFSHRNPSLYHHQLWIKTSIFSEQLLIELQSNLPLLCHLPFPSIM